MKTLIMLAALTLPTGLEPDGPFHDLTFELACEKAVEEKKVVMIDFFTTWCGPCKQMDRTTWKDANVVDWLDKKTVSLKLDAEKSTFLAKRFKVDAYPTMIFFEPEVGLKGRIVGFKDGPNFLKSAADVLNGVKASDRVREKLAESPGDPSLKMDLARELKREGNLEEAHELLLWCWDHGDDDPTNRLGGVRVSFLVGDLKSLAKVHPPMMSALQERRDAAEAAVLGPDANRVAATDLLALNKAVGKEALNVVAYDKLKAKAGEEMSADAEKALARLFEGSIEELLKLRRYVTLVDGYGDPSAMFESKRSRMLSTKKVMSDDEGFVGYLERKFIQDISDLHEAFAGTGDNDADARLIATALVDHESSARVWNGLMESAGKAERTDIQIRLHKDALAALPEDEHAELNKAPEPPK